MLGNLSPLQTGQPVRQVSPYPTPGKLTSALFRETMKVRDGERTFPTVGQVYGLYYRPVHNHFRRPSV